MVTSVRLKFGHMAYTRTHLPVKDLCGEELQALLLQYEVKTKRRGLWKAEDARREARRWIAAGRVQPGGTLLSVPFPYKK